MKKPSEENLRRLRTTANVLAQVHAQAEENLNKARAEYEDALQEWLSYQDSLCHALIKSGRNPAYCTLERGHEGAHWDERQRRA